MEMRCFHSYTMMVHYILFQMDMWYGGIGIFKSELNDNGIYVSIINLKSLILLE